MCVRHPLSCFFFFFPRQSVFCKSTFFSFFLVLVPQKSWIPLHLMKSQAGFNMHNFFKHAKKTIIEKRAFFFVLCTRRKSSNPSTFFFPDAKIITNCRLNNITDYFNLCFSVSESQGGQHINQTMTGPVPLNRHKTSHSLFICGIDCHSL